MATFTPRDLTLARVAVVRILGIDPGTQVVGYGCLEVTAAGGPLPGGARLREVVGRDAVPLAMRGSNVVRAGSTGRSGARLLGAGVMRLGGRQVSLPERLLALARQFAELVREFGPHEVALEQAFYGKSVQAALRIGEARGVVLAESARVGIAVHQYAPARIKRCVTGYGSARKQSVAGMLEHLIPGGLAALSSDLPADATDALAVAWTRLEERRSPLIAASSKPAAARPASRATPSLAPPRDEQ